MVDPIYYINSKFTQPNHFRKSLESQMCFDWLLTNQNEHHQHKINQLLQWLVSFSCLESESSTLLVTNVELLLKHEVMKNVHSRSLLVVMWISSLFYVTLRNICEKSFRQVRWNSFHIIQQSKQPIPSAKLENQESCRSNLEDDILLQQNQTTKLHHK